MTYTVTVDVHDLEPGGPVPASAELRIWRDQPAAPGTQVVSTRQHTINVGTGPTTFTATAGVVYWAELTGVRGWEKPFAFLHNADTSLAELYRLHQVDPTSFAAAPLPQSVADVLATKVSLTDHGDGTATLA